MNSSSYLACCLQRGQKGQWTMQPEELLDKFKETNKTKHDIAIKHKTCNVIELRIPSIMLDNKCNCNKKKKRDI